MFNTQHNNLIYILGPIGPVGMKGPKGDDGMLFDINTMICINREWCRICRIYLDVKCIRILLIIFCILYYFTQPLLWVSRQDMTQMRISVHLKIKKGRFKGENRRNQLCTPCTLNRNEYFVLVGRLITKRRNISLWRVDKRKEKKWRGNITTTGKDEIIHYGGSQDEKKKYLSFLGCHYKSERRNISS